MRILMVHKFFHRATSTGYMFDLSALMERHGHKVIHFSMQDPRNEPSPYASFFVSPVDFNAPGTPLRKLMWGLRALYSVEAHARIQALVRDVKPDVAFLHSICTHLSPSILVPLRQQRIPMVMHIQDYSLICPNYTLLSHGQICERCKGHRYYNAVLQRCYRNSLARSLAMASILAVHRATRIYERNIDCFICPSRFLLQKMLDFGVNAEKLVHIPQAVSLDGREPSYCAGDYIVFFGWLRPEKGVATLLRSVKLIRETRLLVVGDGEQRGYLEHLAKSLELGNVTFTGPRFGKDLMDIVRGALCVVVPSEWYEVYGMTTYEAFALGKPVIGSRIGATPELVEDGITGALFDPGDWHDLAAKIQALVDHPGVAVEMGRNARQKVEGDLSAERNYAAIMALFRQASEASASG